MAGAWPLAAQADLTTSLRRPGVRCQRLAVQTSARQLSPPTEVAGPPQVILMGIAPKKSRLPMLTPQWRRIA